MLFGLPALGWVPAAGCYYPAAASIPIMRPHLFVLLLLAAAAGAAHAAGRAPARVSAEVRVMTQEEIAANYRIGELRSAAAGIFVVPLPDQIAAEPGDAATRVLGPPRSVGFDAAERVVRRVFADVDFARLLARAIERRGRALQLEAGEDWVVEATIGYYGLQAEQWRPATLSVEQTYCLVADGWAGAPVRERFERRVAGRSAGMPPPVCLPLSEYAAAGGAPLRRGLEDGADVLAAWIVNRLLLAP